MLSPTTLPPLSSLLGGEAGDELLCYTQHQPTTPPGSATLRVTPCSQGDSAPCDAGQPGAAPRSSRSCTTATIWHTLIQQRFLYHGQQLVSLRGSVASPAVNPSMPPSPPLGLPQGLPGAAPESPWVLAALPLKHRLSQSTFLADIFFMTKRRAAEVLSSRSSPQAV